MGGAQMDWGGGREAPIARRAGKRVGVPPHLLKVAKVMRRHHRQGREARVWFCPLLWRGGERRLARGLDMDAAAGEARLLFDTCDRNRTRADPRVDKCARTKLGKASRAKEVSGLSGVPAPPNFGLSAQLAQWPQSSPMHPWHSPHRTRLPVLSSAGSTSERSIVERGPLLPFLWSWGVIRAHGPYHAT